MSCVIYDLETTGLNPRYDQPVQFAAVRLDDDLNEVDAVELLACPQNHILPAPGALLTHGHGIQAILDAPFSHYELMAEIDALAAGWGPAIWAGYNSIRFDEEFLRHSNYCALRQPYMTQLNGNSRGDVMRLAQLAAAIEPGALRVPIIRGRPSFKLAPLAAANGFLGHAAHDALGDVRATIHLMRIIRSRALGAWALFPSLVSRAGVIDTLLGAEFAVVILHFGVAVAKPVLPVCANPDYPAQWLAIDLSYDPSPLLGMDPLALAATLAVPHSPLCRIKTNGMPLVIPGTHPSAHRIVAANVRPDVPAHAQRLRADRGFAARLVQAARLAQQPYPPAQHFEERLYEGGFFPSSADESRVAAFHAAEAAEKFPIAQSMADERARYSAMRIIYNEWPREMPARDFARIDLERHARYRQPQAPWTTIDAALAEIARLQTATDPAGSAILDEYRSYLTTLGASDAA
jgi:exodeoxyribonuclease-1